MTATEDAVQEEAATDPVREAIAQSFADELGDGFIAQHINPGSDLWIRIAASSWVDAARFGFDLGSFWSRFGLLGALGGAPGKVQDVPKRLLGASRSVSGAP